MEDVVTVSTFVKLTEEQERLLRSLSPEQLRDLERRVAEAMQATSDRVLFSMLCEGRRPADTGQLHAPVGFINPKVTS